MAIDDGDPAALGASIAKRRKRYGISPTDFAELVAEHSRSPFARSSVYKVEAGEASMTTMQKVARALEAWEAENGFDVPEPERPNVVTFRLQKGDDFTVSVEGPIGDLAALEASISRLARQINADNASAED